MGWSIDRLRHHWLLFVFTIGLLHASAYALLVPVWQAPDEPGHIEYACLLASQNRPPTAQERTLALETAILQSLDRQHFWQHVGATTPDPLPEHLQDDPFLFRSGRQVGDEPPLYYVVPALICRTRLSLEAQVRLIRLWSASLFGLTGAIAAWGFAAITAWPGTRQRLGSLLLVLLPMPAFMAGSVNNDVLATLTATAVFAASLQILWLGWRPLRGLGLLILLALAVASKKTNSYLVVWLAILGLAALSKEIRCRLAAESRSRRRALSLAIVAVLSLSIIALLLPSKAPAAWRGRNQPVGTGQVSISDDDKDGWAVQVVDRSPGKFGRLFQSVTGPPAESLRGRVVVARALVRSPGNGLQPGRLTVRDAAGYSQVTFTATEAWQAVALSHTVSLAATYVKVALAPGEGKSITETGQLLADYVTLHPVGHDNTGSSDSLLPNGDFGRTARWGELLLLTPFAPRLAGGKALTADALQRYGLYGALTFAGFWGNFGWLQRPFPIWLYGLLALVCLIAAAGVFRALGRGDSGERWTVAIWVLALILLAVQTFAPMIGRDWQPQGRYLFSALLPFTGLLILGLDSWFRFSEDQHRIWILVGLLLALDLFSLLLASQRI
ncbi:MAG: DUF2142 domain-containing protein [Chloroflexota bacterium]|nr:DUF2142 domain-containing protein [Chloroflexota bacterium]